MPELALDDVDRDALTGELDGMGVPELMRRETASDPGRSGQIAQLTASGARRPPPAAGLAVDDAEQRPGWQQDPVGLPGSQLGEPERVHSGLAAFVALAVAY